MNYSKEDYENLKKIRDKLYTACYCQFVRLSNRDDIVMADEIYKRIFHTTKGILGGCSHCVYEACKKLGKLFFEDEKAYEKAEKEENTEEKPKKKETAKKTTKNKKK